MEYVIFAPVALSHGRLHRRAERIGALGLAGLYDYGWQWPMTACINLEPGKSQYTIGEAQGNIIPYFEPIYYQ